MKIQNSTVNTIAIIASLVIIKELTALNDQENNKGYTFIYNIAANDYFMVSSDALPQYKNNASFFIPN